MAVYLHVLAGHGIRGYGVCWEDVGVVPDVAGDHGDWGLRPPMGGRMRVAAGHRLPPQVQFRDPRSPRNRGTPAAASPPPPGRLCQGPRGTLHRGAGGRRKKGKKRKQETEGGTLRVPGELLFRILEEAEAHLREALKEGDGVDDSDVGHDRADEGDLI